MGPDGPPDTSAGRDLHATRAARARGRPCHPQRTQTGVGRRVTPDAAAHSHPGSRQQSRRCRGSDTRWPFEENRDCAHFISARL